MTSPDRDPTNTPSPERDDAAFVDALFAELEPVEPSAELVRRVAEIPLRHEQEGATRWWWPFENLRVPAFALAAAAALGVAFGALSANEVTSTSDGATAELTDATTTELPTEATTLEAPSSTTSATDTIVAADVDDYLALALGVDFGSELALEEETL